MKRRSLLQALTLAAAGGVTASRTPAVGATATGKNRITRVRYYHSPDSRPTVNQSGHVVTIETEQGITGVGEGGTAELAIQAGAMLIGQDASRIEHLWQVMYRGYFYPPGREKLHAVGGLDLALWDIRGKTLGVPVYDLLGGLTRDHIECYSTAFPWKGSVEASARACIDAGFRAYRMSVADPPRGEPFNSKEAIRRTAQNCEEVRRGVGYGDWAIDFHTRLDLAEAIRLSGLIEEYDPYFVEDLVRSENPGVYRQLRNQVKVPIAVGEHFGDRWEINELVENRLIDYSRISLPNAGGITEFRKIAALCETHYVGLIPHFTGPIGTAALVHACATFPGPVLMEILGEAPGPVAHLPIYLDFRDGKLWPNRRPGLGVEFDPSAAELVAEVTEPSTPVPMFHRPDGSYQNW
jgi:galactonate dehydratase